MPTSSPLGDLVITTTLGFLQQFERELRERGFGAWMASTCQGRSVFEIQRFPFTTPPTTGAGPIHYDVLLEYWSRRGYAVVCVLEMG